MTEVIIAFSSLLALIVGTGGILFHKQNKRLKAAEAEAAEKAVIAKDLENQKTASDEWIRLYKEAKEELNGCHQKIAELQGKLYLAVEVESQQRLVINDLEWSRCVVNGCAKRQPPRDFEKKREKIENMHESIMKGRVANDDDDEPENQMEVD